MSRASTCSDLRWLIARLGGADFTLIAGTIAEAAQFAAAGLGASKVSSADITISSPRVAKTSDCSSRIISVGPFFHCIQNRGNERRAVDNSQGFSFDPCELTGGFIIHEGHASHVENDQLSFALMVTRKVLVEFRV